MVDETKHELKLTRVSCIPLSSQIQSSIRVSYPPDLTGCRASSGSVQRGGMLPAVHTHANELAEVANATATNASGSSIHAEYLSDFACYTTNSNRSLCLFGSTCASFLPSERFDDANLSSAATFECVCSPGYTHDLSIFYQPNCGLPRGALAGIFGLSLLAGLIAVVLTMMELRGRKPSKIVRIAKVSVVIQVLLVLQSFSVFIEGAKRETGSILLGLVVCLVAYWCNETLVFIAHIGLASTSTARLHLRGLQRSIAFVSFLFGMMWAVGCIVLAVFTRYPDWSTHNTIVAGLYWVTFIVAYLYALLFWFFSTKLLGVMSRSMTANESVRGALQEHYAKVRSFRRSTVSSSLLLGLSLPILPIVVFRVGSFPFSWIAFGLLQLGTSVGVGCTVLVLLKRVMRSSVKEASSTMGLGQLRAHVDS